MLEFLNKGRQEVSDEVRLVSSALLQLRHLERKSSNCKSRLNADNTALPNADHITNGKS